MKKIDEQVARYADMFAALGAEPRLRIVRLLLSAHPDGMVVNEIQAEIGVSINQNALDQVSGSQQNN